MSFAWLMQDTATIKLQLQSRSTTLYEFGPFSLNLLIKTFAFSHRRIFVDLTATPLFLRVLGEYSSN